MEDGFFKNHSLNLLHPSRCWQRVKLGLADLSIVLAPLRVRLWMKLINAYGLYTSDRRQSGISTGDFTWKDASAALRLGMSLETYVIGGMDPDLRELLYRAGLALDAAGIHWTILSAFRDDYRQSLVSGFKAHTDNSLHGGVSRLADMGTAALSTSWTQMVVPTLSGNGST